MKYSFTTPSGNEVLLSTVLGTRYYFELHMTCEVVGFDNLCVYLPNDTNVIKCFSKKLDKMAAVDVPADIADAIRAERKKACSNTGKIIVIKVSHADGEDAGQVMFERYANAIADPIVDFGPLNYRLPSNTEIRLRSHSSDNKIYEYGGIEDGVDECKYLTVEEKRTSVYYMRRYVNDDPFCFGTDALGHYEECEISLALVTPECE